MQQQTNKNFNAYYFLGIIPATRICYTGSWIYSEKFLEAVRAVDITYCFLSFFVLLQNSLSTALMSQYQPL